MQNTNENKMFLLGQISLFLDRFSIGMIKKEILLQQNINKTLKYYIQLLQDCIYENKKEDGMSYEKPPLGVLPKDMHNQFRALDILAAMDRYVRVNKSVPQEWLTELVGLCIKDKQCN